MSYLLPLWYILSDIALWNSDSDQLVVRTTTSTHARAVICELFLSSGQSDATIRFDWYITIPQGPPSMPTSTTVHLDTWPLIFQALSSPPGGDYCMIVCPWHPHFTGETLPYVLLLYAVSVIVILKTHFILW
ncbi:hypothetical protein G6F57_008485 [Rhizopus arrhizus]|uniref:Uncharacterized protein n=1 Tax=Rhizopus oryzae TaxID=64495 RepID=A0A9P7BMN0_RHIOR|nr:hypothetical protein G6F23_004034 [Rhizopus arrhizus]KAG1396285.1 hypothetical protein G6F58_011778 [Rhizopus delemar]KAG0762583.1 hypothetical protein G6F24_006693 [Rhizopus arrhizus]KAG0776894.1 hypothetical protein G6F22_012249 [Rhizopus arrhizus]KAG0793609.1 hypothetical protein G6F21_003487 [Rhizopus arrhizus]